MIGMNGSQRETGRRSRQKRGQSLLEGRDIDGEADPHEEPGKGL